MSESARESWLNSFTRHMEQTMPGENSWSGLALFGLTRTCLIVLDIAAEIGLDTALGIQLTDTVEGGRTVLIKGAWGSAEVTDDLWFDAEHDLCRRRQEILSRGGRPPSTGPFFYYESGRPVTTHSLIAVIHERLYTLRICAEERKRKSLITAEDRYYRTLEDS